MENIDIGIWCIAFVVLIPLAVFVEEEYNERKKQKQIDKVKNAARHKWFDEQLLRK